MRRIKQQLRYRLATEGTKKGRASKERCKRGGNNTQQCFFSFIYFFFLHECTHFASREAREKEKAEMASKENEEQVEPEESASTPENEEEETKAAVVLQSNYRGYKERKKFKERKKTMAGAELELPNATVEEEKETSNEGEKVADKQENEEEEESTFEAEENDDSDNTQVPEDEHTEVAEEALSLNTEPKTEEEEKAEEDSGQENNNSEEETKAATVLQSNFRGYKERKRLEEEGKIPAKRQKEKSPVGDEVLEKEPGSEEAEEEEPTESQGETSDIKSDDANETKAAVVIQSNFRGHMERKRLEEEGKLPKKRQKENEAPKEEPRENISNENQEGLDEEKAATVIQSNFRGHRDRKRLKAEREAQAKAEEDDAGEEPQEDEQDEALDVVDVLIECKDETDAEKERLEEEQAAVKIQSNFRGYKDRKNLRANKQAAQKETRRLESFSRQVTAPNRFLLKTH